MVLRVAQELIRRGNGSIPGPPSNVGCLRTLVILLELRSRPSNSPRHLYTGLGPWLLSPTEKKKKAACYWSLEEKKHQGMEEDESLVLMYAQVKLLLNDLGTSRPMSTSVCLENYSPNRRAMEKERQTEIPVLWAEVPSLATAAHPG